MSNLNELLEVEGFAPKHSTTFRYCIDVLFLILYKTISFCRNIFIVSLLKDNQANKASIKSREDES